ncbi:MAG: hypothetical protein AAFZ18_01525 [Myxococcota bacterium]
MTALGCGGGAFGNFTDGLDLDRCDGTFPVCESTAGCVLTETTYTEGEFPGQRQVIVNAPAGAVLNVELFFVEQNAAGLDTEIRWHEPGCFETYRWLSDGEDVFRRAGESRVLAVSQQVREPGDHLVEIFSDAVATYRLRVRVDGL